MLVSLTIFCTSVIKVIILSTEPSSTIVPLVLSTFIEMVVKRQLSKSIKNEITFEKKLHDEVPSGKNYIIKNIKGKDFIVVKNLEGQNKETLVNSILSDHFLCTS
jgi:hypothetical protein